MTNSQDSTTTSCFSSVFRRLLCAGGLPTHPSSDADSPNQQNTDDSSIKLQPSPTRTTTPAGIVARLMGLDSFPNSPRSTYTKVSLGTIMRKSKSVGSVDFLPDFDIAKQPQSLHTPHHRRIKTSLSFREVPTTFLQASYDNDLGKVDAIRISEMGLTPIEEKLKTLTNKSKKKKINGNKIKGQSQSLTLKVIKSEEEVTSSVKLKCTRKRGVNAAKKNVVEDGFPEEQKKKYKSRKRRYIHDHPLPKMEKHEDHDRKGKKKKNTLLKRRETEYSEEYCMKVLVEVFKLTMEEIKGGAWVDARAINNPQEISYEISQEILQVLVYEVIHELYM